MSKSTFEKFWQLYDYKISIARKRIESKSCLPARKFRQLQLTREIDYTMEINNWDRWQTFRKDRGTPPWIKVYRNLFSNPEWAGLSDAEKGHLVSIWILAADKAGTIPDDPSVVQRMCMLTGTPNINKFIELGFLLPTGNHVVDTLTPTGCQLDAPETETETEKSKEKPKAKRFAPPTQNEVLDYMLEKGNSGKEAGRFIDFYESKGWLVGRNKMKDWKAAVRNWIGNDSSKSTQSKIKSFKDIKL